MNHRKRHSASHVWHGVNLHHPLRSMQQVHPVVLLMMLFGFYFTCIAIFITVARLVAS